MRCTNLVALFAEWPEFFPLGQHRHPERHPPERGPAARQGRGYCHSGQSGLTARSLTRAARERVTVKYNKIKNKNIIKYIQRAARERVTVNGMRILGRSGTRLKQVG